MHRTRANHAYEAVIAPLDNILDLLAAVADNIRHDFGQGQLL